MNQGFFTTRKLSQTLTLLQQMPGNSNRIPLVLAPIGAGKSLLLEQLCFKTPPHWQLCRIQGGPLVDRSILINKLAESWLPDLAIKGEKIDEKALVYNLTGLASVGKIPVVVVDDTDLLPSDSLKTLLLAHRHENSLFFPILFADTTLQSSLPELTASLAIKEPFHLLPLSPWNSDEIAAYFKRKTGQPPRQSQLDKLIRHSKGLPGKLILPETKMEAPKDSKSPILSAGIIGTVTLLFAAVFILSWLLAPQSATEREASPAVSTPPIKQNGTRVVALPRPKSTPPLPDLTNQAEQTPPPVIHFQTKKWLQTQKPGHFTLQLISLRNLNNLKQFALKHKLNPNKLASFTTPKEGLIWHSLVYGSYPDKRTALRARLLLPDTIDPESVWPRSFKSIHKIMKP